MQGGLPEPSHDFLPFVPGVGLAQVRPAVLKTNLDWLKATSLEEAKKVARSLKDPYWKRTVVGFWLENQGQYEEASKIYRKAWQYFSRRKEHFTGSLVAINLAECQLLAGWEEEALATAEASIEELRNWDDSDAARQARWFWAKMFYRHAKPERALELFSAMAQELRRLKRTKSSTFKDLLLEVRYWKAQLGADS